MNPIITILTPTYNRDQKILNLYNSLKKQSNFNFIWLIVDDGSQDETMKIINEIMGIEKRFQVKYIYKENGGKHTACNLGVKNIETELVLIVDSDDILVENAISIILEIWEKYKWNIEVGGLCFLKENFIGEISGKTFPKDEYIGSYIEEKINNNNNGETAEVWRTSILKENPFKVYPNEKYIGERTIWIKICRKYKIVFINKVIYKFEYLKDGLTKRGRILRIKNPYGGMEAAKCLMIPEVKYKKKIKAMLLFTTYLFYTNEKIISTYKKIENSNLFIFMLPFGYLLSKYWKCKYKGEK